MRSGISTTRTRGASHDIEGLQAAFAAQNIAGLNISPGTTGSAIALRANAFPVTFSEGTTVHQYSIEIVSGPEKNDSGVLKEISQGLEGCRELSRYSVKVLDGARNVFIVGEPLPANITVKILVSNVYGSRDEYIVSFSKHKVLNARDLTRYSNLIHIDSDAHY